MAQGTHSFSPLDFLQLVAVPLIWGVNNVLAMVAIAELPPLIVAGLRFTLVLGALFWMLGAPPAGRRALFFTMLAVVGPLHMGVQYVGLGMARDLAPMVVAMQLWAPASVVFAAMLLGERVGALRGFGVALAFIGAAGMNFEPAVLAQWPALALVALASMLYGLGTVLVRRLGGGLDPWAMQAWVALACAPSLLLASAAFERGQVAAMASASWLAWACIVFGALVSSILANAFMFRLLQRYEVSRTTPYMLLTPVVSFSLASLVLGDTITPQILVGAGLAMAGVALVALAEQRGRLRA